MIFSFFRVFAAFFGFSVIVIAHEIIVDTGLVSASNSEEVSNAELDRATTRFNRDVVGEPIAFDQLAAVSNPDNDLLGVGVDQTGSEQSTMPASEDGSIDNVVVPAIDSAADHSSGNQKPQANQDDEPSVVESKVEDNSEKWSAVWRPFFSPTTAQGFANYISESTGLVLRVQPASIAGHYLVEVQHRTEAERIDADRRIVEFTGYQPPGGIK